MSGSLASKVSVRATCLTLKQAGRQAGLLAVGLLGGDGSWQPPIGQVWDLVGTSWGPPVLD